MPLFTIILQYRDGTYLEQAQAANQRLALQEWAKAFPTTDRSNKPRNAVEVGQQFLSELRESPPIPVEGLQGVWCSSCVTHGKNGLALVTIVRTSDR